MRFLSFSRVAAVAAALSFLPAAADTSLPPAAGLQPAQLAIVINDEEPNSVEIGEYYRKARNIPDGNVVHVRIPHRPRKLDVISFGKLKDEINAKLGPEIQAVLFVWTAPYAVECNSLTSAYALGFDAEQCAKPCGPGKPSPYFNSNAAKPAQQHMMRLAMLMPTESVADAKALIGRGTAGALSMPSANAYFLITSEQARNSRAQFFPKSTALPARRLSIKTQQSDVLEGARDIMFYQTGKARVEKLETLQFLPGALADHLTSTGGDLLGTTQMSSLRWLEAGATASYGSVSEPCNYWQKFPNPAVLLRHYLNGASAVEAYWRSVAWPAQGLFIGEPLAAPYRR
nr:TIGR03790 family protein [Massilia sp. YIM B04103]